MKLLIIRHGDTPATEQRLYCGATDISLSENGRDRLIKAKAFISAPPNARYITSGMKRCDETMLLLFPGVRFERDMRLCEMDFGAFEMRGYDELKSTPEYQAWISGDNESNRTPGGESGKDMQKRALEAFSDVLAAGRDAVIVTHGGVIAALMASMFPEEGRNRYEWQCAPGGGYAIEIDGGAMRFWEIEGIVPS